MAQSNPFAIYRQADQQLLARLWQTRDETRENETREEQLLLAAMREHREFHPLWDRLEQLQGQAPEVGGMNPVLHVMIHAAMETQLDTGSPPEVGEALEQILQAGFTHHRAIHLLATALSQEISSVLIHQHPYDDVRYRSRIQMIGRGVEDPKKFNATVHRTRRNDPCPCGSGRKFKRCCIDYLPLDFRPTQWINLLPGGSLYCTPAYAEPAPDDDPIVCLQNTSAVAAALEAWGDLEGAFRAYQYMEDVAKDAKTSRFPSNGPLENVLQDIVDFALNHPAFAVRALERSEVLLACCTNDDLAIRTTLELDHADLLTYVGRPGEAEAAYARAAQLAKLDQSGDKVQKMVADRWEFWHEEIKPLSGTSQKR
jgi:hypothetical protein